MAVRTLNISTVLVFILVICFVSTGFCTSLKNGEGYILSSDGVRLFYRVAGNGQDPVIVLHGGPGNTMESIRPDLEPLERDNTLIYYDQRGNGHSDLLTDRGDLALPKHIEDLETIRRHFKLDKVTLLGNSWGGLLASFYAAAHPDKIARMILLSPASPSFDLLRTSTNHIHTRIPADQKNTFDELANPDKWLHASDPLQVCRRFYDILVPVYFADTAKAKNMRGETCGGPPEAIRRQKTVNRQIWQSLEQWDIRDMLHTVWAPVLILHGEDDIISLDSSRAWIKAYPDARLLVIENCGHMTYIEQPEKFFKAVRTFLKGEWPEGIVPPDG